MFNKYLAGVLLAQKGSFGPNSAAEVGEQEGLCCLCGSRKVVAIIKV